MIPEGAVLDWAALYLRQEMGTDLATAGFAYAGFAGAMAIMRFLGDGVRNRFGAVTTLRFSSLVAAAGMCIGGLSPWPWLAVAAFAFCGFGVANMVPITFSAGGNQPGMSSGTGMSVVTTMGYSGISAGAVGDRLRRRADRLRADLRRAVGMLVVVCLMAAAGARRRFRAALRPQHSASAPQTGNRRHGARARWCERRDAWQATSAASAAPGPGRIVSTSGSRSASGALREADAVAGPDRLPQTI